MTERAIDKIRKCDMDKPYIFISYSSKDMDVVYQDVLEFQRRGYNVWLDEKNLDKTKSTWQDDALEAIKNYNSVLLIFYVSRNSLISKACYDELLMTRNEVTIKRHKRRELNFIAVEVEPIADLQSFADEIDDMVRADKSKDQNTINSQIDTLSDFLETFFNNNNARVRMKCKDDPCRAGKIDYYEDILLNYCSAAANQPIQEVSASTPKPAPASNPTPKPAPVKAPKEMKLVDLSSLTARGSEITVGAVRARFVDPDQVTAFRAVREGMPRGGKGAMDYAMAAILGGCNQVTATSPAYQIHYYTHAVANPDAQKSGSGMGATWTWSSNCRKILNIQGSGQIPNDINQHFQSLPENTTLGQLEQEFLSAETVHFQTSKNDLVISALQQIMEFMENQ